MKSKKVLIAELRKLGIPVVDEQVKKSDVLAALKEVVVADSDLSDQYEIYDMGWDSASYFPGFGTSGTNFEEAIYEVGYSPRDAADNLSQLVWEMQIPDEVKDAIVAELKDLIAKAGKKSDERSLVGISGSFKMIGKKLKLNSVDGADYGHGYEGKVDISEESDDELYFESSSPSGESSAEDLLAKLEEDEYEVDSADEAKIMKEGRRQDDGDYYYHIGVKAKSPEASADE